MHRSNEIYTYVKDLENRVEYLEGLIERHVRPWQVGLHTLTPLQTLQAKENKITNSGIARRMEKGMTAEEAINKPVLRYDV